MAPNETVTITDNTDASWPAAGGGGGESRPQAKGIYHEQHQSSHKQGKRVGKVRREEGTVKDTEGGLIPGVSGSPPTFVGEVCAQLAVLSVQLQQQLVVGGVQVPVAVHGDCQDQQADRDGSPAQQPHGAVQQRLSHIDTQLLIARDGRSSHTELSSSACHT